MDFEISYTNKISILKKAQGIYAHEKKVFFLFLMKDIYLYLKLYS